MPHAATCDAIVLKVMDVGEADRFAWLLTRELGVIPARAKGVRKMKSRLGGQVLPGNRITVSLVEHGSSFVVTGAVTRGEARDRSDLTSFLCMEEILEGLLGVLEDRTPLSAIFDCAAAILGKTRLSEHDVLVFEIRLLRLLGVLPETLLGPFAALSESELTFVRSCIREDPPPREGHTERVGSLVRLLLEEQTRTPLKARDVGRRC